VRGKVGECVEATSPRVTFVYEGRKGVAILGWSNYHCWLHNRKKECKWNLRWDG